MFIIKPSQNREKHKKGKKDHPKSYHPQISLLNILVFVLSVFVPCEFLFTFVILKMGLLNTLLWREPVFPPLNIA